MDASNGHDGPVGQGVFDCSGEEGKSFGGAIEVEKEGVLDPDAEDVRSNLSAPTRAEIEAELASLSRDPFRRVLADYLGFVPTPAALRRFANSKPDKWATALSIIAQLAGYKRDTVEVNNFMMIGSMDDATLLKRLKEVRQVKDEKDYLIESTAPPPKRELAPSRDPDIIDVQATIKKE